jgi:hypothetical protein
VKVNGVYEHPTRTVFFLGDFVDRGPKIKEVLDTVIGMCERGSARSVMGNHEFNLMSFHMESKTTPGTYLRSHNETHIKECNETLKQIPDSEIKYYLDWMETLPMFHEEEGFRAVHAYWYPPAIEHLTNLLGGNHVNKDLIHKLWDKKSQNFEYMEMTLKGYEIPLPTGYSFFTEGTERHRVRFCWWDKDIITTNVVEGLSKEEILLASTHDIYPESDRPIFFGHYWRVGKPEPFITAKNAQCLDFSVAKGGHLTAYRFSGEGFGWF